MRILIEGTYSSHITQENYSIPLRERNDVADFLNEHTDLISVLEVQDLKRVSNGLVSHDPRRNAPIQNGDINRMKCAR